MKFFKNFLSIDLQLCAEGGAAGGGEGAGVAGAAAGSQEGVEQSGQRVVYGRQETAGEAAAPEEAAEGAEEGKAPDLDAEFRELIKGKYKKQYGAMVSDTVRQRLQGTEQTGKKLEAVQPILDILAKKHGVKADDLAALTQAIEQDDTYFEQEAMERNMSVAELKAIRKMELEQADLRRQVQQYQKQEEADKTYGKWMKEAEAVKAVYHEFDLSTELENPQFGQLLMANIDVKTAFEVIHKDDILPAAMQYAAKTTAEKLANNVRSRGNRPAENGTRAHSSAIVKNDPSKLTDADVAEVMRRVSRGEHITFG